MLVWIFFWGGCKQVSNLAFYAQSTSTVISGQKGGGGGEVYNKHTGFEQLHQTISFCVLHIRSS